jgi:hypothetical protein
MTRIIEFKPIYQIDASAIGEECWIVAREDSPSKDRKLSLKEGPDNFLAPAFIEDLKQIFVDGNDRGSRLEIYHNPTDVELDELRNLATKYHAEVKINSYLPEARVEIGRERKLR